ncbi:MAG: addiction module protein [Gaiellales bacterium]|nr:addiction module protein [Gaiellales bacterium]
MERQHAIRNGAGYDQHMGHPAIDIDSMPPEDRLELIGELWDSLRRVPDSIPVPDAHRDELDARLHAIENGEAELVEWDEALRRMRR